MVACVSGRITSLFPRVKPIADSSIKHLVSCFESEKTERIPLLTQKYCNCSAPIKQNYILLATIWSSPLVTMETARSHPFHTVSKISDPVSVIAPPQQPRVNLAGFAAPSPATENNCQSFSSLASGLWKFYKLMNMSSLHPPEPYMHAKARTMSLVDIWSWIQLSAKAAIAEKTFQAQLHREVTACSSSNNGSPSPGTI